LKESTEGKKKKKTNKTSLVACPSGGFFLKSRGPIRQGARIKGRKGVKKNEGGKIK